MGDLGSIAELGRSPGERNSYTFQYSGLENSMDGGAWWATVDWVTKSRTRLSEFLYNSRKRGKKNKILSEQIKERAMIAKLVIVFKTNEKQTNLSKLFYCLFFYFLGALVLLILVNSDSLFRPNTF